MKSYQALILGLVALVPTCNGRVFFNAPMHAKVDSTTHKPVPVEADLDIRVKIDTKAEDIAAEVSEAVMKIIADKIESQATEEPMIETTTNIPDTIGETHGIMTTVPPTDTPLETPEKDQKKHHKLHRHKLTQYQRDHIRDLKICVKLYNFYPGHTWYRKLCRQILKRRF